MTKLFSINELEKLRDIILQDREDYKPCIIINAGTCGQASGANNLVRAAKRELLAKNLSDKITLRITGCHGFCQMEPSLLIEPGRTFYPKFDSKDMRRVIDALVEGKNVTDLLYMDPATGERIASQDEIPFFKKQHRSLLRYNEMIDPIRIYDYIENDGYLALSKVMKNGNSPQWVIEQAKQSGLRGRGGGGFPTGLKWEMLAGQTNDHGKYLVCNADEGDPGAYMDRSILEGNPHSIIEGMIIGAFGTNSNQGIIYIRKEYPLATKHLIIALRQARDHGLLGNNILGSGFSFDIRIIQGAGAFVCGEETALIKSIEGKMGEPHQRPPYPVQKGIDGCPTVINNVETWANVPIIFRKGAKEFAKIGTKGNTGTKIFSLVGKIRNTGLVEVPMGCTIREIVYDIGGGPEGKEKITAVQTGGPSGGCIPADMFDLPIDYDSLAEVGSIMGSGGMIVMDENTCMVDVAKYFMNFLMDESCGKCFTCRKGTQRMHEILDDVSKGQASLAHLELLEELAEAVKDTTMCGLGQTASNPVLNTLRYFHNEYERHVVDKKCDAFVCHDLVGSPCQTACPLGTEAWRYIALIEKGEYKEAYGVIRETNPFPSVCARVCDHRCEYRCRLGTSGSEPVAIRALKRFLTDRIDPSEYKPMKSSGDYESLPKVAVVGAGPAGLAAAHDLSLNNYNVTIFEADDEPGGKLVSCIPTYRLPRSVLNKEINALLNENITIKYGVAIGREITIDDLFKDGFKAVFIAIGAHECLRLGLEGEEAKGVYPSIEFLKAFILQGEELAKGQVGVIGGSNSAVDAARVALRQKGVDNVTIFYRRTHQEMPAFQEEIEAAILEGIKLEILVSPISIHSQKGNLTGIECIRNDLREVDSSGRRRPVPVQGTEFSVSLDTLIVAIGERPASGCLASMDVEYSKLGRLRVAADTLCTNREGVFAGGDIVTGPNTVVDAIAAGKKAAAVIDRYINGKDLHEPPKVTLPEVFVEPSLVSDDEEPEEIERVEPSFLPIESRKNNFLEVEMTISEEEAISESRRCLRCDLEFTQKEEDEVNTLAIKGETT